MSLLHINGFTTDASAASLRARYPTSSAAAIGSPQFRVEGYAGGDAIRARGTGTLLTIDAANLPFGSPRGDRIVFGCRIKTNQPELQWPLLAVYGGTNNAFLQFQLVFGRPTFNSRDWNVAILGPTGRILATSSTLPADEWVRIELKADISSPANAGLELRIDGITEIKLANPIILNSRASAGWGAAVVGFKSKDSSGYVDLDDLYVCDGRLTGSGDYGDFLGDVIVDHFNPLVDAPLIPAFAFTPGGTAATVTDGVDDGVSGQFDGDTSYAQASSIYGAQHFLCGQPLRTYSSILAMSFQVTARVTAGAAVALVRYFVLGPNIILGAVDGFVAAAGGYRTAPGIMSVNPLTGARWKPEELGALLYGVAKLDAAATAIRVSQVSMEVLALASPEVVPQDVPRYADGSIDQFPFPVFEPNWRDGIVMTTSYQTSITRGRKTAYEDRRVLQDRPLRVIEATFTSLYPELTRDLLIRMMKRSTRVSTPSPIWQDRMVVVADVTSNTNGTVSISVDSTSYRRIFRGQRILVVANESVRPRHRDRRSSLYFYVKSWTTNRIHCENGPGQAIFISANDRLYPCIDADLEIDAQTLQLLTTGKGEGETWIASETQGASTLPGSITDRNQAPFIQFKGDPGNAPLWPFQQDWSSPPTIEVTRYGEFLRLGKSSFLEADGNDPVFTVQEELRFFERSRFWRFLQFFDYVRGRGGWFWYPMPVSFWTVDVSASGGNVLQVILESFHTDPERLFTEFFKELAVLIPSGFGSEGLRRYGVFTVLNASRVSGTSFVRLTVDRSVDAVLSLLQEVRFAVKMRLSSDSFTERWTTLTQCDVEVSLTSLEDVAPKPIQSVTFRESTEDIPRQIPDLYCWMDSNRGVYSYDFNEEEFTTAHEWPHRHWPAHVWFDSSLDVPRRFKSAAGETSTLGFPFPYLRHPSVVSGRDSQDQARLQRFQDPNFLRGQRAIVDAQYLWGPSLGGTEQYPIQAKVPWDNQKGMTLIVCLVDPRTYNNASTTLDRPLVRVKALNGTLFEWLPFNAPNAGANGAIRIYRSPGQTIGSEAITFPSFGHRALPFFSPDRLAIAVFRWKPNVASQTQMFWNGIPAYTKTFANSPQAIATGSLLDPTAIFSNYLEAPPPEQGYEWVISPGTGAFPPFNVYTDSSGRTAELDRGLNREGKGAMLGFLAYERAIENSELNQVCGFLAQYYGLDWTDV